MAAEQGITLEQLLKEKNISDFDAYIDEYVQNKLIPQLNSTKPEIPAPNTTKYMAADGKLYFYDKTLNPTDYVTYLFGGNTLAITSNGETTTFTRTK